VDDSANTGHLIALALKRAEVSHLFTLNGAHIWPILIGASEQGIWFVAPRQGQTAAFAADGRPKECLLYPSDAAGRQACMYYGGHSTI